MPTPSLVLQTTYAELMDRCAQAAFGETFTAEGVFTPKTVKGRRYWYFQSSSKDGRVQKYVGPETSGLLKQIEEHRRAKEDERERRSLVSTLVRSFAMPQPPLEVGAIVAALAQAGVFRLRGVLVGTVAYQTYAPMLGTPLPAAALQTGDVDIAQFKNVSVAVEDRTGPMLDVLRQADASFRAVPTVYRQKVTSYRASGGFRVDFLTPNEGRDTDKPQHLLALQTDAQPLRFLDFLIHDPQPAVLLHGAGIYVNVPAPERFAIHKLIVSRRRKVDAAKRDKDVRQAEALIEVLLERRPHELRAAWDEAYARGVEWRRLLREAVELLSVDVRARLSRHVDPSVER
jgi:hypothetical protein